ncbi:teneurin-m [Trichonephila clavipes]|nr:teneurin-m [Trichonephila clavipes]
MYRSPGRLHTRTRLSSVPKINRDSSLNTNFYQSVTFHIDLARHHCRRSCRCSGVKGSARKGRLDLRFASARCLEIVCGTIATPTSARIVERVTVRFTSACITILRSSLLVVFLVAPDLVFRAWVPSRVQVSQQFITAHSERSTRRATCHVNQPAVCIPMIRPLLNSLNFYVGYEYRSCPKIIWEVQTTQVSGHDMSVSDIGGWNLDIHHKYNFHEVTTWIPANFDIFGYEQANNLAKKAQNSPQLSNSLFLTDADVIARRKLTSHPFRKHFIPEINFNRVISNTIAILCIRHFKGMKISSDGQRSYLSSLPCDVHLSPNHIFNCPSILAELYNIGPSTVLYAKGRRHNEDLFRCLRRHLISMYYLDKTTRGILQKGDGNNIYLKNKPKLLLTTMGDGQQRPLQCQRCNGLAKTQRLLAPVALASGPDGTIYVGDFNLIRKITPDGQVTTVVELSPAQVSYSYHLTVGPVDGHLYISDPEQHQILRTISISESASSKNNTEAVVGSGEKCLPRDKDQCGDGRSAKDARLAYPKGIAITKDGEIYIADGTNIRYVDTKGIIHTLIGDYFHKSWRPIPCYVTLSLSQVYKDLLHFPNLPK